MGCRLIVDGGVLIDAPLGQLSPESDARVILKTGWHAIEIDSYHDGSNPSLQLSWQPPKSEREVIGPEVLATGFGRHAVMNQDGWFRVGPFPSILTPLDGSPVPADKQIQIVLDQNPSQERPIQQ